MLEPKWNLMTKRVTPLNTKQLERWRPEPVRTMELVDGAIPGLRVRLAPSGEMSWSLNARVQAQDGVSRLGGD